MKHFILLFFIGSWLSYVTAQTNLTFNISDVTIINGQDFEVDIRTTGFSNITTFQFSLQWDTTYLSFDSVTYMTPLLSISNSNFNTLLTENGKIGVTWFDALPKTLPLNQVLFKIKFKSLNIGSTLLNFTSTPTEIYAENNGGLIQAAVIPGTISILQPSPSYEVFDRSIRLYPNPCSNQTVLEMGNTNSEQTIFELLDKQGNILQNLIPDYINTDTQVYRLNTSNLPAGNYLIYCHSGGKSTALPLIKI